MIKRILFISILFVCGIVSNVQAASTSSNREFWVSYFGVNPDDSIKADPTLQQFFILVSSKKGCTGTVTNPNTGYSQSFTVAAGNIQRIYIPYKQCYNHSDSDSIFVTNRGIIVSTSDSASVYLGNYQSGSYDACAVFPTQSLGTHYRVACTNNIYNTYAGVTDYNYASILAVATEDNTKIRFNLANKVSYKNNTYNAHTDYDTTLNKGQTLAITGVELLGSTLESTNCKKFAVFSGNYISYVPYNYCCGDVLVEQMEPVNSWGEKFMVESTLNRPNDSRIYIMANKDATTVTIKNNGTSYNTLMNAGDYLNINSVQTGTLITSDKPISVTQYAISAGLAGLGDPMMMNINSEEQMVKESIFTAPSSPFVSNHYLEIFTKTKDVNKTILDSTNIGSSFSPFIPDASYSYARIKITADITHYMKNEGGFLAYVYGYNNGVIGTEESYGYSLNWSFYNLEDYFNVSNNDKSTVNIYYQTTDTTNAYKVTDTITVSRNIQSDFVSVSWLLNGNPYTVATESTQAELTWKLPASDLHKGENTLSMLIKRACMTDTINSTLWLANFSLSSKDTTICKGDTAVLKASMNIQGQYHWTTPTGTVTESTDRLSVNPTTTTTYYVYGTYNAIKTDTDTITVRVKLPSEKIIYDTICSGKTYSFAGSELSQTGKYLNRLTAANGCDSIITLYLYVIPTVTNYISATINNGESYPFNGTNLYTPGTYTETTPDAIGCDSIITILTLKVKEDTTASIPQGFSPNGDGINDYFLIKNIEYYPHNHILIFNRWGDKVYEASPYENKWDGKNYFGLKVGGNILPEGTYFYILDLGDGSAKKKGYIFLGR
ncbi:MAG: gliding motility-associated C-terminal domain-containing protein [Paludibacteraceae bacterium]|nr:gliding motility-associated C-terminal domain-containing protein [Paludibacteraceae bacterium]